MKLTDFKKHKKAKKPKFLRQDAHKKKRLESKWQNPRGHHSKIRWGHKGHRVTPKPGYGLPEEFKNLHISGLKMVLVNNVSQISKLDPKTEAAIISATVGTRKKTEMMKKAQEKNIKVLNVKDSFLKSVEERFAKKQETKKEAKKKQEKKEEKTIESVAEK